MPVRVPPSRVKGPIILEDRYPNSKSSARFAAPLNHQSYARSATSLSVRPNQTFVRIDANSVSFDNYTPQSISEGHRPERGSALTWGNDVCQDSSGPAAKRRRLEQKEKSRDRRKLPVLAVSRPVKNANEVHLDAWRLIFGCSKLKFLLEAKTVNKDFYNLLQDQSIWKRCRENEFGKDMPGPPPQMTEQKYADLIVGRGCQSSSCPRSKTSKVRWAFQARLCDQCLKRKICRRDDVQDRMWDIGGRTALDLLPAAYSECGKYKGSRFFDQSTLAWNTTGNGCWYLKHDFEALDAEYREMMQDAQRTCDLSQWALTKFQLVIEHMAHLRRIERWSADRADDAVCLRYERICYFREKAAEIAPPISREALEMMLPYQSAVEVNSVPTERAWNSLKSKIIPLRELAEEMVLRDYQMLWTDRLSPSPAIEVFRRLHFHRHGRKNLVFLESEQEFVLNLGHLAFKKCQEQGVADLDLVLTVLQHVYDSYDQIPIESRPHGLNYDGSEGSYVLSLDDARMIVEEIIEPTVDKASRQGATVLGCFKCMGCTRKDATRRFTFQTCFDHIMERHAKWVGDGSEYHRFFQPFSRIVDDNWFRTPWYAIPWFRSLPILPGHVEVHPHMKWDPETRVEHLPVEQKEFTSPFQGRDAFDHPDILPLHLEENMIFAAKALDTTNLDGLHQAKIVLSYGFDRYKQVLSRSPSLEIFEASIAEVKKANTRLTFEFRCAVCTRNLELTRSTHFVKSPVSFSRLKHHWFNKHALARDAETGLPLDWSMDMLHLPTDAELAEEMEKCDEGLRKEKDRLTVREAKIKEGRGHDIRLRRTGKEGIMLERLEVRPVFERLFPTKI